LVILIQYYSSDQIERNEMSGARSRYGERSVACWVLVEKPERKTQTGRPWRRWENDIMMDLRKWDGGMDWIDLAQDRDRRREFINVGMDLRILQNAGISGRVENRLASQEGMCSKA
jgi:hypothetical protein